MRTLAILALAALALAATVAAWQQTTQIRIGQIRLVFSPADFAIARNAQTGETIVSLAPRPRWTAPVPRELNCKGAACEIVSDPLPAEVEIFRNGLLQSPGKDFTRGADRKTITLATPAELDETFFVRYWYE